MIVDSSYDLLKRGNNYTTYAPVVYHLPYVNHDKFSYDGRLIHRTQTVILIKSILTYKYP